MASKANSSPAVIPVSNPPSARAAGPVPVPAAGPATTGNQQLTTAGSPSAARAFLSGIIAIVQSGLPNRRPWRELLDRSAFSKPETVNEATLRLSKNYAYFRTNYLVVVTAVLAVSLLTNPFSLFLLSGLLASWLFLYIFRQPSDPPINLFGRQYSDRETFVFLIFASVFVFFMTSVGSLLVSALMIGVGGVSVHGAFRSPEDLFLDEQDQQGGVPGFLSIFTNGAAAAAVAQPPVTARV